MRLPREISSEARARRALLIDSLVAVAITVAVLFLAAGIGVVGFLAVLVLLCLVAWWALETAASRMLERVRRGRR